MKSTRLNLQSFIAKQKEKEVEVESNDNEKFFDPSKTQWKSVTRVHQFTTDNSGLNDVMLSLSINRDKQASNISSKQFTFRIGKNIAAKLNWADGERIALFYDEKNPSNMMLVKSPKGYILREEEFNGKKHTHFFKVVIRASFIGNDEPFKGVQLKNRIDQGRLLLVLE